MKAHGIGCDAADGGLLFDGPPQHQVMNDFRFPLCETEGAREQLHLRRRGEILGSEGEPAKGLLVDLREACLYRRLRGIVREAAKNGDPWLAAIMEQDSYYARAGTIAGVSHAQIAYGAFELRVCINWSEAELQRRRQGDQADLFKESRRGGIRSEDRSVAGDNETEGINLLKADEDRVETTLQIRVHEWLTNMKGGLLCRVDRGDQQFLLKLHAVHNSPAPARDDDRCTALIAARLEPGRELILSRSNLRSSSLNAAVNGYACWARMRRS